MYESTYDEILDLVKTDIKASLGYKDPEWLIPILFTVILSVLAALWISIGYEDYMKSKKNVKSFIYISISSIAVALLPLVIPLGQILHNSRNGVPKEKVENCITVKRTPVMYKVDNSFNLEPYKELDTVSVITNPSEGVNSLVFRHPLYADSTPFIKDKENYIIASVNTYEVNSEIIKNNLDPSILDFIGKAYRPEEVTEIHYIEHSSTSPTDLEALSGSIIVDVNTSVTVNQDTYVK